VLRLCPHPPALLLRRVLALSHPRETSFSLSLALSLSL